jgi:hypothetical protein
MPTVPWKKSKTKLNFYSKGMSASVSVSVSVIIFYIIVIVIFIIILMIYYGSLCYFDMYLIRKNKNLTFFVLFCLFLLVRYPYKKKRKMIQIETHARTTSLLFICTDEKLPILMSLFMGFQHCLCMVGGLITPPLVVFKFTVCGFAEGFCPELVQVSVILFLLLLFVL